LTATNSIAIFGGTFDPIHYGHVHVISEILKSGRFSKLVIVPAGNPWQKSPTAPASNRFEMTKRALSNFDVEVSDCEVKREAPSYAIDTVHDLRSLNPESSITWIIGSDAIAGLSTWNRIDELASEVEFLIVLRPGHAINQSAVPHFIKWSSIEIHARDISATQIRERVSVGSDISDLVPPSVAAYIYEKKLYGAA
jgi:nicotinate-nucleotide adenylyltransferase